MAFAAPIAAFSATQRTPSRFNAAVPLRHHAAVPVLRHVLPDLDSCRPFLQAVAWLTPLCHGVALTRALSLGTSRTGPAPGARPRARSSSRSSSVGTWCGGSDDRAPAGARMTAASACTPAGAVRQPPGAAPDRAEPLRLPARLDGHRRRASSSRCSTCWASASGSGRSSGPCRARAASRSRTSCSSRRHCSRARR